MCLFVILLNTATKILKMSWVFSNSLITIYTVLHEAHSLLLTPINRAILSNRPGTVSSWLRACSTVYVHAWSTRNTLNKTRKMTKWQIETYWHDLKFIDAVWGTNWIDYGAFSCDVIAAMLEGKNIFSPLGNKVYFHAKLFHCFSPPTWPPWKPSIGPSSI